MADIVKDDFDISQDYVKVIFQRGRDVPDFDLNVLQDIERMQRRRVLESIFGNGFISTGFQVQDSLNPNEISITAGVALIQGEYIDLESQIQVQNLTTPSGGPRTDVVYL